MSKVTAILKNKWFIQGIGLLFLFLLIWFVGPLIAIAEVYILSGVASRLLIMVVITGLWLANIFRVKYLSKKTNDTLMAELGQTDANEINDETSVIGQRFDEALKTLNTTKGKKGAGHLYELPWYIIIGPPGSGKTTALVNSGLHFPLEGQFGTEALKGVGGTRHCDWWFTDEAVLIDTAGRFTTQDSHESVDKAAWQKFMDLLKKYRKQRPINGALIAVSITDIIDLSEQDRVNYAYTIRLRIDELTKHLGIGFPVYFMFTKCDLIAGFNEFFAALNGAERAQVWGETFALGSGQQCVENYPFHFEQLIGRLKNQLLTRIHDERDIGSRPAILGFPAQMASIKEPVTHFLNDVFSGNRYQGSAMLRGVYYTSGTQQGTPIDRLLGKMANNFGMESTDNIGYGGKGKSYFLKKLLLDVVFPEAEIAGVDTKLIAKRIRLQRLGYFGAVASLIGAVSLWVISFNFNMADITTTQTTLEQSAKVAFKADLPNADFRKTLEELNLLRKASNVFDPSRVLAHSGLYQGDTLVPATNAAYLSLLENKLLPVIAARLQEIMIELSHQGETALLYEVLKAYLMYAGINEKAGVPLDKEWLLVISRSDWVNMFAAEPTVVEQLAQHHLYLLDNSSLNIVLRPEDKHIVQFARKTLQKLPLSQQVYQSIKQNLMQDNSKDLLFTDMAGNYGLDVFVSRSGKSLASVVMPGLFTKGGFYQDFIAKSVSSTQDYLTNNWVLGAYNANKSALNPDQLKRDVFKLYYQDYSKYWSGLIRDLKFKPVENMGQGLAIIQSATDINGPIETLVKTIALQTNLSQPISSGATGQGVSDALGVVSGKAQSLASKANQLARASNKVGLSKMLGQPVTQHFQAYHLLVKSKSGTPMIDRLAIEFRKFAVSLNETLVDSVSRTAALKAVQQRVQGIGRDPFSALRSQITFLPPHLKGWLKGMSQNGWSMMLSKAREDINLLWTEEVIGYYDSAIVGRYPLDLASSVELELRDFTAFFKPKGRVENFIQQYLKPFINTKSAQWRPETIDGQVMELSTSTLNQLQNAHKISQLFFSSNANSPRIAFVMKPLSLDSGIKRFSFVLGGQKVEYAHGPRRAVCMSWPLDPGNEQARIRLTPQTGATIASSMQGPWSLFRILESATLKPTGQRSTYQVLFELDGLKAQFELRVDSEFNPLGDRLLQNFSLPQEL
ncbi:MAG: type VI secretion system membrane subunit TssM [Algicola sp.]|nr:type VI secretion system membrane subunit TssM [Algicola sp.]